MAATLRRRAPCDQCGNHCRATPLEVMLRGAHGWRGYWAWRALRLCPPCQRAFLDSCGELELQEDEQDMPVLWPPSTEPWSDEL